MYWIDRAQEAVQHAASNGAVEPFAAGNATYLRLQGELVIAHWDFDPDEREAQSIPVGEFLDVLVRWRRRVIDSGGVHGPNAALVECDPPTPMGPAA